MSDLDPNEAIRPALDAFRRGTKRSRLRVLAVVCRNGHTLLEVFPSPSGPVALWPERPIWRLDESGRTVRNDADEWQAAFVADDDERAMTRCRCSEGGSVDFDWLGEQVASGVRRVVAPNDQAL